eukprot:CAMPEP_0198298716 /NCGR_PEP_ID=MMETSP1449-20131203/41869_1 /TAXON_ID=420275 /ORGANISM="Attheya septentrionalis, Strain CCMP2084" /LENGTH=556 /DNA_ID=CAMNT_0044000055 /DNA_START=157 /DNA_END=1827 /DNA_ORIENTATION=+
MFRGANKWVRHYPATAAAAVATTGIVTGAIGNNYHNNNNNDTKKNQVEDGDSWIRRNVWTAGSSSTKKFITASSPLIMLATSPHDDAAASIPPTHQHHEPKEKEDPHYNRTKQQKAARTLEGYPYFSKFHRSLLAKYLTPEIYMELKDKVTSSGVTLEDVVQSGMSLPFGHHPPRGMGLLAGDAECYSVFSALLDPIIEEYHNFRDHDNEQQPHHEHDDDDDDDDEHSFRRFHQREQSGIIIRRHQTNINPISITSHNPDPENKYILSTRMRVARSIEGFRFPSTMSREERRHVQSLVQDAVQTLCDDSKIINTNGNVTKQHKGSYIQLWDMTNDEINDLIQRHILFDHPNEWGISAGFGRDWPDGRGLYMNHIVSSQDDDDTTSGVYHKPDVIVWCNEEDHVRIICMRKGGDIKGVFTEMSKAVDQMEVRLVTHSGRRFSHDERLGYLASCPTNIGTGMRASVHVKLMRLGKLPGFVDMVRRMRLEVRGMRGEMDKRPHTSGIFDISNAERLGKSEVKLINVMIEGVSKLIELEQKLECGEKVNCDDYGYEKLRK